MKKHILFTLSLAMLAFHVKSQSISLARAATVGSAVSVRGKVINGSELGSIRYLQDGVAGIAIYGSGSSAINRGDSIIASGTLTSYNNLLEITPFTYTVITPSGSMPSPLTITPNAFNELYEGRLIRIDNCTISNGGGTFAGNTNYTLTAGAETTILRVSATTNLVGTIIPSGTVSVIGIGSQFCSSPASGCTNGYQLLPRDVNDILNNSSIYLTSQPEASNISTTGFTVNWTCNIAGTYYLKYGQTPALELGTLNGTGTSASPSIAITSAPAATIYYAKVFSENGADKDSSKLKVFCTKSLSTGDMKVYFNRPVDHSVSSGLQAFYNPAIADSLSAYINRAKSSLDLTIYDWDNSVGGNKITSAINAAYARGVKVRLIYDGSVTNGGLLTLDPNVKRVASPQGTAYTIMHNKFVIIDANRSNPNDAIVWTGSTNWSNGQLLTDPNNVIIFQDQSMARGYKLEFDEMWGDSSITSNPNATLAKFGQFKTDNTPHQYQVNGNYVESYFSPSDGTNAHILSTIATANTDLYFAQLLITRTDIANKIKDQINLNAITAKGILNDTAGAGVSPYFIMRTPMGASNLLVNKFTALFHHKYLIVDPSNTSSDPLVLTGSHNWSNGADQKNDENTVIIHDATIANLYFQEFTQRFNDQITTTGLKDDSGDETALIYPNPTSSGFYIQTGSHENTANIQILNVLGKEVASFKQVEMTKGRVIIHDLNLPEGIYIVQLTEGSASWTARLLVRK